MSGIITEKFYINLIMRVFYCNGLSVFIKNTVAVLIENKFHIVRTRTCKESACSTGISRRLHGNLEITVVIIVFRTCLTCSIVELNLSIIKPCRSLFLGNTETHNAVFINHVVLLPYNVENVTVCPSVRLKEHLGVCTVCKINKHICIKWSIGKLNRRVKNTCHKINYVVD